MNRFNIARQSDFSAPSGPEAVTIDHLIAQVRDVLNGGGAPFRQFSHISPELYQELEARARVDGDLSGWDGLRVDLHKGNLTVGCRAGFGHEILSELFDRLRCNNTSYPRHYNGSRICTLGQANIPLTEGTKSPDFSLYEQRGSKSDIPATDIIPTVACETGNSEDEEKLALDAARLICLSRALVLLVITVKFTHAPNTCPRKLEQVVWTHWEPDYGSFEKVDSEDGSGIVLNDPKPLPHAKGGPPPHEAYVKIKDDIYRFVAHVTESFVIFPSSEDDENDSIPILYRHLFRSPVDADADRVAFQIPIHMVREVIEVTESTQRKFDHKWRKESDEEALAEDKFVLERMIRKKGRLA